MFDLKHEVEEFSGKKIDIDKYIDLAQKEAKARGQKIDERPTQTGLTITNFLVFPVCLDPVL